MFKDCKMITKPCSKCGAVKPIDDFSRASKEKSGRKSRCKSCVSEDDKAFRLANPEKCKEWERRSADKRLDEINARSRAWYAANKEKAKATRAAWRERNAEKDRADVAAYQLANAERLKAAAKIWSEANRDKCNLKTARYRQRNPQKVLENDSLWRKRNRHKVNAKKTRRIAAQLQATPNWADPKKIGEFYFAANFLSMVTGEWHHVDHIVPIRSKSVCGFHCQMNLRVISGAENQSKGNRHWPDMP